MILEVCVESVAGAIAAGEAGAERVELCAELHAGGCTPSPAAMRLACERSRAQVVVLVRARAGDFEYSALELEQMCADVRFALEAGAAGVAVGALTPAGRVDTRALARFVEAAGAAPITFHRAFDWSARPLDDLELLIEHGVRRVLTSGGAPHAELGLEGLRELAQRAAERIEVIAAGGVRAHNAARIARATGVRALHFTAFEPAAPAAYSRAGDLPLSAGALPADDERRVTSAGLIRELRAALGRP